MYSDQGDFTHIEDGRNEFTKMTRNINEHHIYNMLRTTREESTGVVDIVQVTDNSVTMEQLDICLDNYAIADIKSEMALVKDYLQSMGIMYIDWKPDNIGISRTDGQLKLFDFDASGIIDVHSNNWLYHPSTYWAYRDAIAAGMKTPTEIDDYAFNTGFST
jgi:serine/threonine protein kinase